MQDLANRTYVSPSRQTLARFLTDDRLPAIETTIRPSTFDSYRRTIRIHVGSQPIGATPLQRVDATKLNRLYADLLAGRSGSRPLSARTVRFVHVILHRAFRDAMRWDRIVRNPCASADPPKPGKSHRSTMRTWSADELASFLTATSADRISVAWWLLATTGMRRGEVLGLTWRAIDLDGGMLSIRRTLVTTQARRSGDPGMTWSEPKTDKGWRTVALYTETIAILRAHRTHQLEERLAAGPEYDDQDLVVTTVFGKPVHPKTLSWYFGRAVKKGRAARDPASRPASLVRDARTQGRHPPARGAGAPRPRERRDHARHLLARNDAHANRGSERRRPIDHEQDQQDSVTVSSWRGVRSSFRPAPSRALRQDLAVEMAPVYRLREDETRLRHLTEAATSDRSDIGLKPERHVVGTQGWWEAIDSGELPIHAVEGSISRVWWGSMGDYPEFEITTTGGAVSQWTREGDHTRYVEGLLARVQYVVQHFKDGVQLTSMGRSETNLVVAIDIEDSSRRSERFGPGPFASAETVTLWRPAGPEELALVETSGFRRWPPRLPEQPIFYPVTSEDYAVKIARDWNVKASGVGYVTRFQVDREYLSRYDVHEVGGRACTEYWIPAEDLDEFNDHIVGPIEVMSEFRPPAE